MDTVFDVRWLYLSNGSKLQMLHRRSTFAVMMNTTKELKLPSIIFSNPEKEEARREDRCLHDDVINFLELKDLGFSPRVPRGNN